MSTEQATSQTASQTPDLDAILAAAQAAADAAAGDSNDEEIDLLREALEMALHGLGLNMPEANWDAECD